MGQFADANLAGDERGRSRRVRASARSSRPPGAGVDHRRGSNALRVRHAAVRAPQGRAARRPCERPTKTRDRSRARRPPPRRRRRRHPWPRPGRLRRLRRRGADARARERRRNARRDARLRRARQRPGAGLHRRARLRRARDRGAFPALLGLPALRPRVAERRRLGRADDRARAPRPHPRRDRAAAHSGRLGRAR